MCYLYTSAGTAANNAATAATTTTTTTTTSTTRATTTSIQDMHARIGYSFCLHTYKHNIVTHSHTVTHLHTTILKSEIQYNAVQYNTIQIRLMAQKTQADTYAIENEASTHRTKT